MNNKYFTIRENCPICGSTDSKELYSCGFLQSPIREFLESFYLLQEKVEFKYSSGANFVIRECNNCEMVYQKEIPNEFLMKKLYEEWIDPQKAFELDLDKEDLAYVFYYAQEVISLIEFFKTKPSQLKFLDFGMGWGKWCQMAKTFGCDSYGTELSETRIEYAQKNNIKVITYDDIPEYCFDFINTEQVFEHISNPFETFCHLKRALKPNGLIKIAVLNCRNIKKKIKINNWMAHKGSKNSLNPVSPLEYINCFNQLSIIKMANIAGFERIKLPIILQFGSTTNWHGPRQILKNILRPVYRNTFLSTYLFFRLKR